MLNYIFLSFAFGAGVAAFFSPCSVALLPGYVTYYLSKKQISQSKKKVILESFFFSLQAILGFFTIFGIIGAFVIFLGQQVKQFIPIITIITAIFLIALGISMLFGKNLILQLPQIFKLKKKDPSAYTFGISYGIAALGCTFPLFVTVLLQGIIDNSIFSGFISLLAYIIGLSVLMISVTVATGLARDFIQRKIMKIIPYVYKVSAGIIIVAGLYMIYYQYLLF